MDSNKNKRKLYSDQNLIDAVAEVKDGESFRKAAKKYNVPVSTVRDRYHGKYRDGKHVPGPTCRLSTQHKEILKKHLLHMDRIGYWIPQKDVALLVKEILDKAETVAPETHNEETRSFKENQPSLAWVQRFMAKNPELRPRSLEDLGYKRSYVTNTQIRKWFADLEDFLREQHGINAAAFFCRENSSRIFNLDETGFPLEGENRKLKIISSSGVKSANRVALDAKEQITVLNCVSAAGDFSNPFIMFPGVRPKFDLDGVDPDGYDMGFSQSGWISADCFFDWIANIFFPTIKNKLTFPIMILMDGRTCHINLAVASFCYENDIILYCFPAHASHIMQPLDVSVYGPLKEHWNDALNKFSQEYQGSNLNKTHFFRVFDRAWKPSIRDKSAIVSGFRECGLVPFIPDAMAHDQLNTPRQAVPKTRTEFPVVSTAERNGMTRVFQIFEECMSEEWQKLFSRRYESYYDEEYSPDQERMYRFYKRTRDLLLNSDEVPYEHTTSDEGTDFYDDGAIQMIEKDLD